MKKGFIYISILAAAVLASCVKNPVGERTLSGTGEKTPIVVVSNVNANTSVTKAVDGRWESGDMMFAYVQHVKEVTPAIEPKTYNVVNVAGTEPRIQYFKVGALTANHHNVANNFNNENASVLTPVNAGGTAVGFYWDDFSVGGKGDENDIRTENHGLRSFYGLCYNGGPAYGQAETHISTNLADAAGTLGWTVSSDQSATNAFKYSDLLFSPTQTPVAYTHGTNNTINGRENVLSIPFTHAMSKVTVVLKLEDGFADVASNFTNTSVVLQGMNTVSTVTAPTLSVAPDAGDGDANVKNITAQPISTDATNLQKSFSALIAPTVMKADKVLAKIVNIDGNNYDLVLTDAVLKTAPAGKQAWSTKLATYNATSVKPTTASDYNETEGGITIPGVHYVITVTIKKQQIKVEATINDWDTVNAQGYGTIKFVKDVTDKTGDIAEALKANGFDIYKSGTTEFGTKETTVSWNTTTSKWEYTPDIYWANSSDNSYFRALSGAVADDSGTQDNESLAMSQGQDVLWGTTAAHSGTDSEDADYSYERGAIINPRTGNVPLEFEHPMSKITVKLGTTDDASAVTLAGAKISIANIYDEGTINLNDGSIADLTASGQIPIRDYLSADATGEGNKLKDVVVIPQSLITLADGTTSRDGAVAFYNAGELTEVNGQTYVTSTLGIVNYTAEEAKAHNATLDGHKTTSDVKTPAVLYTDVTAAAYNETLEGAVESGDPIFYTYEEFRALTNAQMTEVLFALLTDEQKKHVCTSVAEYIELKGLEITGEEFNNLSDEHKTITCTLDQYIAITPTFCPFGSLPEADFNSLSKEARTRDVYTEETAKTHNAGLTGAVSAGQVQTEAVYYTQAEANAYNATLPGAVHEGDFKEYDTSSATRKNPGDLKTNETNPKIMMLIRLADETTYVLDLASCTAYTVDGEGNHIEGDAITTWKRGKHYTYTISLAKEQITFRAMIKDWVEKTGSGNANLEWD